jgi:chaperone modulatory protein CbpM
MMEMREFQFRARVETDVLHGWVDTGWLVPDESEGRWTFHDIDLGRAQLIQDLERDFGVNGEGIILILDLVDRMSGMRRTLGHLALAIQREPDHIRDRIADGVREVGRHAWDGTT